MRVLILHSKVPDYLSDGLFHGLREKLGSQCVDVPRCDYMYAPLAPEVRQTLRGHGFTLYGLLQDLPEVEQSRLRWRQELDQYDMVIIANIWRQIDQYIELSRLLDHRKLVVIDGADASECFPYATRLWIRPKAYLTPIRQSLYFKRELFDQGEAFGPARHLPSQIRRHLGVPQNVVPLAFSIPACKITHVTPSHKTKDFNRDIVDPELAEGERAQDIHSAAYPFATEADYYKDMQISRFGVTTRRAGWDCLRHYEIAANGAVMAFRQLDQKPVTCSPLGLSRDCCLIYRDRNDLKRQIEGVTADCYARMQSAGYDWIARNTTLRRSEEFLERYKNYIRCG